jgi:hypothetical protein
MIIEKQEKAQWIKEWALRLLIHKTEEGYEDRVTHELRVKRKTQSLWTTNYLKALKKTVESAKPSVLDLAVSRA